MAKIIHHEQKSSDKFGVYLIRKAADMELIKQREKVHYKPIFTTILSENYRYPRNIEYNILDIGGCKVEVISRKKKEKLYAILHLHGGAYVLDYNDTYRKVAKKYLSFVKNVTIYSPRYSLAPQHPYPTALNECIGIYKYLLKKFKPENIIFTGDSAGGGLSLAMGLYLKDHDLPLPKAMILLSPWTDLAETGESYKTNYEKDMMFGKGTIPLNIKGYAGDHDLFTPYISPKYGNYEDFCDLLMFVGGDELILSDTLDVAEKLDNCEVHEYKGMFHVFPLAFNKMSSSRMAWKLMKQFVRERFN